MANWERWARLSGLAFALTILVGLIVFGEGPAVNAAPDDLVSFYDGHRGRIISATLIVVLAWVFFAWFVGAAANAVRERGEGRLAATAVATGTVFLSLQLIVFALTASLAHSVARNGDGGVLRAMHNLAWTVDVVAALPGAGFIVAVAVGAWRARLIPAWLGWYGLAAALLLVLRATNWASDGFWAPSGEYAWIAIAAALSWVAATSWVLSRAVVSEGSPEVASARPT